MSSVAFALFSSNFAAFVASLACVYAVPFASTTACCSDTAPLAASTLPCAAPCAFPAASTTAAALSAAASALAAPASAPATMPLAAATGAVLSASMLPKPSLADLTSSALSLLKAASPLLISSDSGEECSKPSPTEPTKPSRFAPLMFAPLMFIVLLPDVLFTDELFMLGLFWELAFNIPESESITPILLLTLFLCLLHIYIKTCERAKLQQCV